MLGQVEAWRDGTRLDLGGRKQRELLACLLVRAGRVVPLDQLIEDLWPVAQPARAAATVQVFVSNLRRILEPDRLRGAPASVLVTLAPGYALLTDAGALDAQEFTRLALEGRDALAEDDAEGAAELLTTAVGLWRGPAFGDLADAPCAHAEALRLEDLRLTALESRVEAELTLGHHVAVVPELEARVQQYPLRERARGQLMLALYRCGRQADALAVYRAGRRLLSTELGLEPDAELRALEQAVLRHDPDLAFRPRTALIQPDTPASPEGAEEPVPPGRVLVVDDSGINRRLLTEAVTRLGHEVRAVEHGRRALDVLAREQFDVVLLDLLMPVLDGFATLSAIKADPALNHVPVIMISAVHELDSVVRCIDLGATDYLPKPFSAAILRARLRSSLAAKRLRDVELDSLRTELVREVSTREAALREEIAALRAEIESSSATAAGS